MKNLDPVERLRKDFARILDAISTLHGVHTPAQKNRRISPNDSRQVKLLVRKNPHKPKTKAWAAFEILKHCRTARDYVRTVHKTAGDKVIMGYLNWAVNRGYARLM